MVDQVQLTLHAPLHRRCDAWTGLYSLNWLFNFHFHSESEKKDNPLAFRRLLFYKEQTFILLNKEF